MGADEFEETPEWNAAKVLYWCHLKKLEDFFKVQ